MTWSLPTIAYNKQKDLLNASTAGHFSLLRALHMADYITELNGTNCLGGRGYLLTLRREP